MDQTKQVENDLPLFHRAIDVVWYLVAFTFSFKVKDLNLRYFGRSHMILLQMITDVTHITIATIC